MSQVTHAPTACYGDSFAFLCVDHGHTSQETHASASTTCCWYILTLLYVEGVRMSQVTHAPTARYRDGFTFLYVDDVLTSHNTRPWTSTAC
jgi:hypothetical protein